MLCYHRAEPIGQGRFDILDGGEAEIDISIAKESRGKGYGKAMLKAAIEYEYCMNGVKSFVSEVKDENASSNRMFIACDFIKIGEENGVVYYSLKK